MELVVIQNRAAVTSSLVVAEIFEKEHKNVLRDIENIKKTLGKIEHTEKDLFEKTFYEHPQNKMKYPMYNMNRDGLILLVMGYTGSKATKIQVKFIEAFNQMEKQLIELNNPSYETSDPIERAKKWMEEQQALLEAEKVIN